MSNSLSDEELDDILGKGRGDPDLYSYKPAHIKYVGEDKVIVVRYKDYASMARGNNYPFDTEIDYDPRLDEDQEDYDD